MCGGDDGAWAIDQCELPSRGSDLHVDHTCIAVLDDHWGWDVVEPAAGGVSVSAPQPDLDGAVDGRYVHAEGADVARRRPWALPVVVVGRDGDVVQAVEVLVGGVQELLEGGVHGPLLPLQPQGERSGVHRDAGASAVQSDGPALSSDQDDQRRAAGGGVGDGDVGPPKVQGGAVGGGGLRRGQGNGRAGDLGPGLAPSYGRGCDGCGVADIAAWPLWILVWSLWIKRTPSVSKCAHD
mmetsp:Transcript_11584/g.20933  ORF Transcript_11584/g.20933 Transcript_11584/m.20933 type:complete len:238 (+) Transcript_11584:1741-2454(+)